MENAGSAQPAPKPYITVVMAIMDVADEFKKTLDGLDDQEFQSFEVLVADCNSKDNPARFISNRKYAVSHYVQGDEGIYDAWNKVLPYAEGEWVIFMGAGDTLHDPSSLRKAVGYLEKLDAKVLMAYGKVIEVGENGQILTSVGAPWPRALADMLGFKGGFCHQAAFQRLSTFDKYGFFNKDITIAGDADMILRLAAVEEPVFFPLTIAKFAYGGVSNAQKSKEKTARQYLTVLKSHGYNPPTTWLFTKLYILRILRAVLSESQVEKNIDVVRQLTGRRRRFS